MKILKLAFIGALALGLSTTSALAAGNADKGQKLFIKKLKDACGMTGAKMAGKKTQAQWEKIGSGAGLKMEIQKICPKAEIDDKFLEHYYEFFYKYASDSGNVPSC